MLAREFIAMHRCCSTGFKARTGCEFSLVSAVGRCVPGGAVDCQFEDFARLAKVDRLGLP